MSECPDQQELELNEGGEWVPRTPPSTPFDLREHTQTFHEGALIFREGDMGSSMYIILIGEVQIMKRMDDGSGRILHTMTKGDFFGEMSLIDKKQRSASALCRTEVTLIGIPEGKLVRFIETQPKFAIKMMNTFVERLRNANEIISKAMVRNPTEVVLDGVREFAKQNGITSVKGMRINVQDFSSWAHYRLGITEAQIPTYLWELVKQGLILQGSLATEVVLPLSVHY